MRRLRDELDSKDALVARTAELFATVEPLDVSELEVERAWRARRPRASRIPSLLRFRAAVAAVILLGFIAIAGATVGRSWVKRVVAGWSAKRKSPPNPVLPMPAESLRDSIVVPAPVPPNAAPTPPRSTELQRSNPEPLIAPRERPPRPIKSRRKVTVPEEPPSSPPQDTSIQGKHPRVLPNEAPILPAR